jgi:hypothetical protein
VKGESVSVTVPLVDTCEEVPPGNANDMHGVLVQVPAEQKEEAPVHAVPLTHCPVPSQVWGVLPLHCLAPGLHTPVHAADVAPVDEQRYGQVWLLTQVLLEQVCSTLPLHCV